MKLSIHTVYNHFDNILRWTLIVHLINDLYTKMIVFIFIQLYFNL